MGLLLLLLHHDVLWLGWTHANNGRDEHGIYFHGFQLYVQQVVLLLLLLLLVLQLLLLLHDVQRDGRWDAPHARDADAPDAAAIRWSRASVPAGVHGDLSSHVSPASA